MDKNSPGRVHYSTDKSSAGRVHYSMDKSSPGRVHYSMDKNSLGRVHYSMDKNSPTKAQMVCACIKAALALCQTICRLSLIVHNSTRCLWRFRSVGSTPSAHNVIGLLPFWTGCHRMRLLQVSASWTKHSWWYGKVPKAVKDWVWIILRWQLSHQLSF